MFGFALDSTVSNLRLGVVDYSHTPESREMISSFTESKSFRASGYYGSIRQLEEAIAESRLDAGMVVPYTFAREIRRGRTIDVQIILNASNANTATIGQGYAAGLIQAYNAKLAREGIRPVFRKAGALPATSTGSVTPVTAFLYNPGLVNAWFIVTGTFGVLLILNGSLVASTAMIKEREAGTVEQLLMTPAGTTEIVVAKIIPLFLLLLTMVLLAIGVMRVSFRRTCARESCDRDRRRRAVRAQRHWHRNIHLHFFEVRAAIAIDGVLRQSAACRALGRAHAGRGHAGMAAADHLAESDSPFRHHHARHAAER